MKKTVYIAIMIVIFATAAPAQEGAEGTDPFYPSGSRPSAPDNDAWGRDPFSNPFAGRTPAPKEPANAGRGTGLTGIIRSKDIRLAIINGELFREGGRIGDRKLAEIRSHSVVLVNAAGRREEVFLENFSVGK